MQRCQRAPGPLGSPRESLDTFPECSTGVEEDTLECLILPGLDGHSRALATGLDVMGTSVALNFIDVIKNK